MSDENLTRDAALGEVLAGKITAGDVKLTIHQFTESLRALPGLNFTDLLAAMAIFSPVLGLRPSFAVRSATTKEPKPVRLKLQIFSGLLFREELTRSDTGYAASVGGKRLIQRFQVLRIGKVFVQPGWRLIRGQNYGLC